jgi:hypothetical protein
MQVSIKNDHTFQGKSAQTSIILRIRIKNCYENNHLNFLFEPIVYVLYTIRYNSLLVLSS